MTPWLDDGDVRFYLGDTRAVLDALEPASVQAIVTSPPYFGLRDYGTATWDGGDPHCDHLRAAVPDGPDAPGRRKSTLSGSGVTTVQAIAKMAFRDVCGKCGARRIDHQIGLEATVADFVNALVDVFDRAARVLRPDGLLWLNLGDTYAASPGKGDNVPQTINQSHGYPTGAPHRAARDRGLLGGGTRTVDESLRNAADPAIRPKNLIGIPWRVAFALQDAGWYLRRDIIWSKPNPMPESVTDRCTSSHEYVFMLSRQPRYYYDADAIREPITAESLARAGRSSRYDDPEVRASVPYSAPRPRVRSGNVERKYGDDRGRPGCALGASIPWEDDGTGRNARSVWEITTQPTPEAHFATYPQELVRRCIVASTRPGDTVLDPFIGSGTTALVARHHARRAIGIDLNEDYLRIAAKRTQQLSLLVGDLDHRPPNATVPLDDGFISQPTRRECGVNAPDFGPMLGGGAA